MNVGVVFRAAVLGLAASSCGGDGVQATVPDGSAEAATDTGTLEPESATCEPSSDASEPDAVSLAAPDADVPLDQVALATAVAQCNYWSRCSPLAAYEVADCVDSFRKTGSWVYNECTPIESGASGSQCSSLKVSLTRSSVAYPGPDLLGAVDAGVVLYDPSQEGACLRSIEGQACNDLEPNFLIPPCIAAFSCSDDGGGPDAEPGDGGDASCAGFTLNVPPLAACTSDGDCAAVDAALPAGPYCVNGYCVYEPCGGSLRGPDGGCLGGAERGQPCDSDPPRLASTLPANPSGRPSTRICRASLTCKGVRNDGGLGMCAVPQDIGGPCIEGAAVTGCDLGLVCQCGLCRMPPAQGACVDGVCRVGAAYCDPASQTCLSVHGVGGACSGSWMCRSGLTCDSTSNTCQPLTTP